MNEDEFGRGQKFEVKRFERERDWIPILLAVCFGLFSFWKGENLDALTAEGFLLCVGILIILWAVLDLRVMVVRHHWAMMRK